MSQVETIGDLAPPVVSMPVAQLRSGSTFRDGGLCAEQVDRFVGLAGTWPPILVSRVDGTVIDGAHRVAAARQLGLAQLPVVLFDGTADEAFIEFVRRNVAHGLALTLGERKRAAARVLAGHPHWSDRRVAELCALSPKTVGRLRPRAGDEWREGRDHRLRPVRREPVRARVVEALRANPGASLRAVAAVAGVSPETVRLVRLNLAEQAADPMPEPTDGGDFDPWFERTAVGDDDLAWVGTVPLSRVYEIADEARRRAAAWAQFAGALDTSPPGRR